MNILFVCTGNTCRSPMAAAYLASKNLPDVNVFSRGLFADGSPASRNAVLVCKEKQIELAGHISAQLTADDIKNADKIFCLAPSHFMQLDAVGVDKNKLFLLGNGITDPFGGYEETYRKCRDEIFAAVDGLIANCAFSDYIVLHADRRHFEEIARLEDVCFSQPWSLEGLLDSFRLGTRFFAAETADGLVAGYIGVSSVLDEGYITNIAVFPEYRRKGIGESLLKAVFNFAGEKGLRFVSLEVRPSNTAAIALYEKNGFTAEGNRKNFYRDPVEDALIMTKRFSLNEDTGH